jgi:hypothetical protein
MYMKRLLFLMTWALFLFSCSEDEKPASNFIEGTKWQATKLGSEYANGELMYSYQENHRLEFTNTAFTLTEEKVYNRSFTGGDKEPELRTVKGAYTFEYPETTLRPDEGKAIKIKIGTYQIETVPEGSGESPLVFVKMRE